MVVQWECRISMKVQGISRVACSHMPSLAIVINYENPQPTMHTCALCGFSVTCRTRLELARSCAYGWFELSRMNCIRFQNRVLLPSDA